MTEAELEEIKAQSELRLRAFGVKVNENLPTLERVQLRPAGELAARAAILNALTELGEGAPVALVKRWLEVNRLDSGLAEDERGVLSGKGSLSAIDRDGMLWRAESVWALSWALGRVEKLSWEAFAPPQRKLLWPDLRKNEAALPYLTGASQRPLSELVREADFAFRLHWAAVDASYLGEEFPADRFHPDLILERRRALQWAISSPVSWADTDLSV